MKKVLYKTNQNDPTIRAYKEAVEKGKNNYHIIPKGNQWIVKKAGVDVPSQVFGSQQEASNYAKSAALNQGTAVFIHDLDGRIKERTDY